jgi:hypothetical protein
MLTETGTKSAALLLVIVTICCDVLFKAVVEKVRAVVESVGATGETAAIPVPVSVEVSIGVALFVVTVSGLVCVPIAVGE